MDGARQTRLERALLALGRLDSIGALLPDPHLFLYTYLRKEAVLSSQIEGTPSSLGDLLLFELEEAPGVPFDDLVEVSNYVAALEHGLARLREGFPLSNRLLREVHARLLSRGRGSNRLPGEFRRSQNWIGGTRPGNARFVPPPPTVVPEALADLDRWIHADDPLPPLVRAGLAHVQFETIHPFLDGNGRIGRLLITLLLEHWGILKTPLLYLSLALKRHRAEYYQRLLEVRTQGDWEGWTEFYLECVRESALDGVSAAKRLFDRLGKDRRTVTHHRATTVTAVRLFDLLPEHPIVTLPRAMKLLKTTKPTAGKAIDALCKSGVLHEISGKQRDRVYAYDAYLKVLVEDTAQPE